MGEEGCIKGIPPPRFLPGGDGFAWFVICAFYFCGIARPIKRTSNRCSTLCSWCTESRSLTWFCKGRLLFWFLGLFQKHVEGWQIFVGMIWLEAMGLSQVSPGGCLLFFVFPSLWCWFLDICLRSLMNPAVSLVRSQPLGAGLCPLGTVWSSHLPKSLAISWVGKKVDGGRERKQKHFTCCLPKDRSLILP